MIKKWAAYIAIVLLVLFPVSSFSASRKALPRKKTRFPQKRKRKRNLQKLFQKEKNP